MSKLNLTEKQRAFIKDYAGGMSALQAYKKNYKSLNDKIARIQGLKLLQNEYVKKEVEKIQEKKRNSLNYTAIDSFNKIKEIQEKALVKNDLANALKAEEMAAKLLGLFKQNEGSAVGVLGDFKEFYAQICAKKDYGSAGEDRNESKSDILSICQNKETTENKE